MSARLHAEDQQDPPWYICGCTYTTQCQGRHPVLRAGTCEAVIRKAGHRELAGLVASAMAGGGR